MLDLLRQSMPCFYSGLCCLVAVQPVQVVHWHTQRLPICKGSGQDSSPVCHCVVYAQLNKWNDLHPIINTLMNQSTYNLLNGMVLLFRLTIGLQMVSTTKLSLHYEHGPQCTPEWHSKTNVPIMNQPLRYTIVPYPIRKEQFRYFGCGQVVLPHPSWYQAGKSTKLVTTHHWSILAITFRQTGNQVHGYNVKFFGWDW